MFVCLFFFWIYKHKVLVLQILLTLISLSFPKKSKKNQISFKVQEIMFAHLKFDPGIYYPHPEKHLKAWIPVACYFSAWGLEISQTESSYLCI